jgi:hypothetical protein
MDDDPQRSDPVHLANRFDGLEAQVALLRRDIKRSAGDPSKPETTSLVIDTRQWPSPEDEAVELEQLVVWVDGVQEQYAAAGDWLVPCWWRHHFAVNELAALRAAWLNIDTSEESSAALDWHEAAEKCRERVRQAIGDGPGCTAVEHYPDRPVTNDPRWIEERAALRRELSNRSGQLRVGTRSDDIGNGNSDREVPADCSLCAPPTEQDVDD